MPSAAWKEILGSPGPRHLQTTLLQTTGLQTHRAADHAAADHAAVDHTAGPRLKDPCLLLQNKQQTVARAPRNQGLLVNVSASGEGYFATKFALRLVLS